MKTDTDRSIDRSIALPIHFLPIYLSIYISPQASSTNNISNRTLISVSSIDSIVTPSNRQNTNKHDRRPVEVDSSDRYGTRKAAEDHDKDAVDQSDAVDRQAPFTHRPQRARHGFVAGSFVDQTADGDGVGRQQCQELERDDGIKGRGRADFDDAEQDGEGPGEHDAAGRDEVL